MTERALSVYRKALALSVHILTATGAVAGLVALMRITEGDYRSAFLYLFLAMGIDMVDGTLARSANVKKVMPGFDGALLDNIVDYLNYTLVPAFFLVKSGIAGSPMSFILAALILLSSAYQFCQLDAKTEDHFFKGFPSYWNILIFYFFLLQPEPATVIFLVLLCVALVFVPVLYLYPSRMIRFKKLTVILTSLYTLLLLHQVAMAPDHSVTVVYASLLYVVYYVVLSLFFTWEKRSRV
ncbi:MAG: CDP-diacylglycerol O-phosphatidyltransferase [Spirochaetales bacterium]|nr:CDP-diacylglycerol O-phosphatidyltransferase [Spirochaetales bacterium]